VSAVDRMTDGYEPDFDIDFAIGRQGELWVARIADAISEGKGRAEVKTDEKARDTGRVYLEYQCRYRGEWKNTGILATPSEIWCHVIGEVMIAAPTVAVKATAKHYYHKSEWYRRDLMRGSHPTRGIVIPLAEFVQSLVSGVPDESQIKVTPLPLDEGTS